MRKDLLALALRIRELEIELERCPVGDRDRRLGIWEKNLDAHSILLNFIRMLNYKQRVSLLVSREIIESKDEAVPVSNLSDEELESSDFFQKYLNDAYSFDQPVFFFGAVENLGAWAWKKNGLDVVCINVETLREVKALFEDNGLAILEYLAFHSIQTHYDNGVPAYQIMKQVIEMFLFYHEVGHLIQEQEPILFSYYIENNTISEEFSLIDHICEFDADFYASNKIIDHIIEVYQSDLNLDAIINKKKYIEDSVIVVISAYLAYRLLLFPHFQNEFYTKKHSHPHLLIRMLMIIIDLNEGIHQKLGIDIRRRRVIDHSLDFLDFLKDKAPYLGSTQSFIEMGQENLNIIGKYYFELYQYVINTEGTIYSKMNKR